MEKILTKLNELVRVCENREKTTDVERNDLQGVRRTLDNQAKEQDERESFLKEQDAIWKQRKQIAQTIEHANEILKKSSEKSQKLEDDRRLLDQEKKAYANKMRGEHDEIDRLKKKISDDRKALDREKKTYKDQVMKAITKNMGK